MNWPRYRVYQDIALDKDKVEGEDFVTSKEEMMLQQVKQLE